MNEKDEKEAKQPDFIDDNSLNEILPQLNLNAQPVEGQKEECIVSDQVLLNLYDEVLKDCRKDKDEIDTVLTNFIDMVTNDGDSSNSTKEAIVNLLKIKSDIADKKTKVADLMTRIKLKERDTFPRYLAAHQTNHVTIENTSKRDLLKAINQSTNKGK
jgi:hypothetical protein